MAMREIGADVVVTGAGIAAAVASARTGARTVLVDSGPDPGGFELDRPGHLDPGGIAPRAVPDPQPRGRACRWRRVRSPSSMAMPVAASGSAAGTGVASTSWSRVA